MTALATPLSVRHRRSSLTAGVLFLVTFVSAIVGAQLYGGALSDPRWVLGGASDTGPLIGAVCELVLIAANIGTALALLPVLRERFPALSHGYVAARLVECGFIAVGILSVLTVVTLQRAAGDSGSGSGSGSGSADGAALVTTAGAFVALHDWTFLLGPGFVVGLGNGLLLGWMMLRSGLVPHWMAWFGLIGGPLVSLSGIAVMFGAYGQFSPASAVLTLPEIVWEASLGIYLTVHGFRRPGVVGDVAQMSA
ncbi:DUF4386 domain-containing protein [Leifsonia sp. F6_8S_P_1B]|uniref:DUF4386 domain-containing protein n=1 Tax=Leifsonia williamsii TaxID=3035919 RepID=A0ABT8K7B9_9MICO|nr:DUF4386 domain-containing protein [Leifsonia williamsii]MDN4612913.1 DUF4386 domain-containing protein [Leifsonia williamsii]